MTKYYVILSRGYMGDAVNPYGTILSKNKKEAKIKAKRKFEPRRDVLKILSKNQFDTWATSLHVTPGAKVK